MRTLFLACFALALIGFCSCEKDEITSAANPTVPSAGIRSAGELSLIIAYGDSQTDTIVVDSFIAVVYGLNQMSLQAWYGGSSAGSYIASTVIANHSGGALGIHVNPGRGGSSYTYKSSAQLSVSQGNIQALIQDGNIQTGGTSIVGEDIDGI